MKLSDAIQTAYNRQWSLNNSFTLQINMETYLQSKTDSFGDDLNISIVSITTPDFTNDPIETYIAGKWFIQNGKESLYRFSITFRDYDQFTLYRKFVKIYKLTKENYFDDVAMNFVITKDSDWYNEEDKVLMSFDGVLVEGVSNLSFSNDSTAQIGEFTVSFKCNVAKVISE